MNIRKLLLHISLLITFIINEAMASIIWTTSFGGSGSGNGQLNHPKGIALDGNGKIYVVDTNNNRIQIFNSDTSYATKFGTSGFGNGQFQLPTGIAVDSNGKIYVVDNFNNRIQIFNSNTSYANQFGTPGSGNGEFVLPEGISLDSMGKIYVSDTNNNRIQIFNSNISYANQFGTPGSGPGQFNVPSEISIGSSGKIYVVDTANHRIEIFNPDTSYSSQFGSNGSGLNKFSSPYGVALDSMGKIYVVDTNNNRVAVLFDPTLWTQAGTTTLGTLTLDQDLTLNNGYNLVLQAINDVTSGSIVSSDAKLTINSGKTLTMNSGSSISLVSLALNGALAVNQNMTLSTPITVGVGNSFNVGSGNTLILDTSSTISGSTPLIKNGDGILKPTGTNNNNAGITINDGSVSVTNVAALGSGTITMASAAILSITPIGDMTLSNLLTGAGSLTKDGIYNLTLAGSKSFTGGTNINSGTVSVTDVTSLSSGQVAMANGASLSVTPSSDMTLTNKLINSGSLIKAGTFKLTLGNIANSFSGGITNTGGTVAVSDVAALGNSGSPVSFANNAILEVTANSPMTLAKKLTGAGSLTKKGTDVLTLSNATSDFTGGITHTGGTVAVSNVAALGDPSNGPITFSNNAILDVTANTPMTLGKKLTGAGSLTKKGTDVLTLSNTTSDFSGGIAHTAGTIAVTNGNALGIGTINMDSGAILAVTANSAVTINNVLTGSGTLNKTGISGLILGGDNHLFSGNINLNGISNIMVTDNSNALGTGTVTMANGTGLLITANSPMSVNNVLAGAGWLYKFGASILNLGGINTFTGTIAHGAGTIAVSDVAALGNSGSPVSFANNAILSVTANSPMTLAKKLTGAGSLTKKGTDVLTLSNATSDFTGGITHTGGTVAVSNVAALGDPSNGPITFSNNAILDVTANAPMTLGKKLTGIGSLTKKGTDVLTLSNTANDFSGGINHLAGTISVVNNSNALGTGTTTMASGTTLAVTANSAVTINNVLAGAGSLTKDGTDNLTLAGNNTFSGGINHTAGTITAAHLNALGTGNTTMANNTTLTSAVSGTIASPIHLAANDSFLNVNTGYDTTFSQIISNSGSHFIKGGAGNLGVGSATNHLGTTEVNAGSLSLIDATLGSHVTVGINTMLKGRGTILGNLINNGIVSPGFSPGIINVSGNYLPNSGSTLQLAISPATNPVAGTDYSQLAVTGTASINNSNLVVNAADGSYNDGANYELLTAGSGVSGVFSNFTLNITGPYEGHLTYDPNLVSLLVTRIYTPPLPNDTSLSTKHASDLSSYIDSLTNMSTDLRQVLDVLYELDETQLDNALRSMTTNRNLTADYVGQDATSLIHAMNNARLSMASDSFIIDNQAGFTSNDKQDNLVSSSTKSNLISSITSNLGTNLINSDQDHIWAAPFAHFARRDTTNRGRGYNSKTGGMILGYDHKFSPSLIGGISLGYYQANFEHHDHGGKDNKVKTTFVAAYGGKKLGQAYLNGSLFAGYNNNLKRQINIPSLATRYARSKHDSYTLSPRLELGYNIKEHSGYQITPFIATEYTSNFAKSYTEKDAESLNMKVKKAENRSFNNELGIKLRKAIKLENDEELALQTKLSYINKKRFKKHNKIKTGFADQNSTYSSDNYSKIEHQISPGFELELVKENGLTIGGSYNGEFSKSYHAHEGMLKMGMLF